LDQSTAELRTLEFRYVNLPRDLNELGYGGDVQFRRLPAGGWIVSKWVIRMPVAARGGFTVGNTFHERRNVVRVSEQGGEVVRIATRDGRPIDQSARATLAGVIRDASETGARGTAGSPLASAEVFVSGTPFRAVTDANGRFRITDLPDGTYTISYLHPRLDSAAFTPEPTEISLTSGRTTDVEMTLPFSAMTGRIGGAEARQDSIDNVVAILRRTMAVSSPPLPLPGDTVPGRIEGRVVDHTTGNPLSGVVVELTNTGQRAVTDTAGSFQFDRSPAGAVTVVATVNGVGTKSGTFRLEPGGHINLVITFGLRVTRPGR
ncbi:MAG: carboxypeptidase regulatory-like domain-containing protein, partial [Longimicrobiales bacterium]